MDKLRSIPPTAELRACAKHPATPPGTLCFLCAREARDQPTPGQAVARDTDLPTSVPVVDCKIDTPSDRNVYPIRSIKSGRTTADNHGETAPDEDLTADMQGLVSASIPEIVERAKSTPMPSLAQRTEFATTLRSWALQAEKWGTQAEKKASQRWGPSSIGAGLRLQALLNEALETGLISPSSLDWRYFASIGAAENVAAASLEYLLWHAAEAGAAGKLADFFDSFFAQSEAPFSYRLYRLLEKIAYAPAFNRFFGVYAKMAEQPAAQLLFTEFYHPSKPKTSPLRLVREGEKEKLNRPTPAARLAADARALSEKMQATNNADRLIGCLRLYRHIDLAIKQPTISIFDQSSLSALGPAAEIAVESTVNSLIKKFETPDAGPESLSLLKLLNNLDSLPLNHSVLAMLKELIQQKPVLVETLCARQNDLTINPELLHLLFFSGDQNLVRLGAENLKKFTAVPTFMLAALKKTGYLPEVTAYEQWLNEPEPTPPPKAA